MCDIRLKAMFYQKAKSKSFDRNSIDYYNKFEKALDIAKKENDKFGINFLQGIENISNRYIQNIAMTENTDYYRKMDNMESAEARKSFESQRKLAHNSLISKINSTKRYFKDKEIGRILELPGVDEFNRLPATDYAAYISIGKYLSKRN